MFSREIDPALLQLARWLDFRVKEHERKFPRLVQLKLNINAATAAVDAAVTDEERATAMERQTAACYALIAALPRREPV